LPNKPRSDTRPSFVLVMTDTQGVNVCGAYGNSGLLRTPRIEALAKTGVRFRNAYTTAPVCTPARSALFTGVYASKSGGWSNSLPLYEGTKTIGQRLRDEGYDTAYIGKWHLDGHDYFGNGECPDGWDPRYWYDGLNYIEDIGQDGTRLWREELKSVQALSANNIKREFTWAGRITDRAEQFLSERVNSERPFLLVVSYDEPHAPFTCPHEYAEPFKDYWHDLGPGATDTLADKPDHQNEWSATNINRLEVQDGCVKYPLYFGCNSFVDSEIGRVIDATDKIDSDNIALFYTSDHGDMLGSHQLTGKGPAMYEEITRVPLIARMPGDNGQKSVTSEVLASHIDMVPTLLDMAGLECPASLDGHSLKAELERHSPGVDRSVVIGFDRFEISNDSLGGLFPIRAIRNGKWKLVINLLDSDELYDLDSDPAELRNLISDSTFESVRDQLHDELLAWMYERRDPFRSPAWERRAWRDTRTYGWWGEFRHVPDDGYNPPTRDYFTGRMLDPNK